MGTPDMLLLCAVRDSRREATAIFSRDVPLIPALNFFGRFGDRQNKLDN